MAGQSFLDALKGYATLAWVRPMIGQNVRILRGAGSRLLGPRPVEECVAGHGEAPWDWRFLEAEDEPLATYEEFSAAFRGVRKGAFAPVGSRRSFHEEIEDDLRAVRWQLAEFIRSTPPATRADETHKDDWVVVRDDRADVESRCRSLERLMCTDGVSAARSIVEELSRPGLSASWRDCLILSAENAQFGDERLRARLRERLYDLAMTLRQSSEAEIKPIVFSAIRCYTSLLAQRDAVSLLAFLEPPKPIETRLVTLQCIVHLFHASPPQGLPVPEPLSDRVYELADKFLDRDWLVPGEKAAIGENATHALAVVGDERLRSCVERIRSLELPWLARQVARKLESTLRAWNARSDRPSQAYEMVRDQLGMLSG